MSAVGPAFSTPASHNPYAVMEKCGRGRHQPRQLSPCATHPTAPGPTLHMAPLPVYSASRCRPPVPPEIPANPTHDPSLAHPFFHSYLILSLGLATSFAWAAASQLIFVPVYRRIAGPLSGPLSTAMAHTPFALSGLPTCGWLP